MSSVDIKLEVITTEVLDITIGLLVYTLIENSVIPIRCLTGVSNVTMTYTEVL